LAVALYFLSDYTGIEIMKILYKLQRYFRWGLLLSGIVFCCSVNALQSEQDSGTTRIDALKAFLLEDAKFDNKQSLNTPIQMSANYLDDAAKEALQASLVAYYENRTTGFHHRERVFEWQLLSSKIIFVVVVLLVLAGLYFSWLQFRADISKKNENDSGDTQQSVSTLEASAQGIKVSSPVLGVVILVISLLFFYLYLQYVYPIKEIL
jgi:hypothetical protein